MKRSLMLVLGALLLSFMVLAGCSDSSSNNAKGEEGAGGSDDGKVTLEFMGWEASPLETESVKNGLDQFMQEHPNIEVKYTPVPNEQYASKLLTMLAGSSAPDVFFLGAEEYRDFQSRDVLMDLTPMLGEDLSLDDFIPSSQEIMEIDGSVYGISSTTVSPVLYYNKDLFDEAGVEYPPSNPEEAWTWDEFKAAAEKLTIKNGDKTEQYGVYGLETVYNHMPLILGNGGEVWTEDGQVALNSPETAEVLEEIKKLRHEDGISPAAQTLESIGMNASQMLQTGKIGMMVEGSWALQELATMGFPIGMAPLPKIGPEPVTHGQAHVHAAWNKTEHPEEAWELIKFLSSEEYQTNLVSEGLWMPNRVDMYSEEGVKAWYNEAVHPEGFLELAPFFKDAEAYPFALGTSIAVRDIINEEMEVYINGDQTLEEAMDKIDKRSAEELAK
ncbi:ABC transporter substrate-binding protein [Sediminibacillus massiliensis]|uniref:ABC transporter substrate-binding protein n=1 Tax=Sediminibacillus massiliensis TaxID=1926277 RepID=UPI0009885E60|nr:sugar ABC transporter substrate-binding protein [Sediminibacillus massiliensis]